MKTQILLSLLITLSACETSTITEGSGPTEPNIANVTTTQKQLQQILILTLEE